MTSRSALNAEIVRLTMENASLRQNRNVVSIETRVESAIKRGIITKAQKRWALSNARAFSTLESQFKSNVTTEHFEPGVTTQTRGAKRTVNDLNGTERHMCRTMGITPEAYLKSLEEKPLGQKLVDGNPDIPADQTAFSGK
jgi:phage I-like protein